MKDDVTWINEAIERQRPNKSRAGLARALGLDKAQATRLLDGDRLLKAHEIPKIAEHLGVAPPAFGFSEESAEFERTTDGGATAPVYDVTGDGAGGWLIHRHSTPFALKPRAPNFANSPEVFGFPALDDRMAPRFKRGEIAWVDPPLPRHPGDDIVLMAVAEGGVAERIVLAELRRVTRTEIIVVQHKDQTEQRFTLREWTPMLVLPRY